MKQFIKKALITTAGCAVFATASASDRPNILIIMADDLGYSDLGCYGGEISTPNLDGLAENGIRYSQMYNTSKCTTTRSALMMGRYVNRTSYVGNHLNGPTFGEIAKSAGYRTLWSGKNHSAMRPTERGFDRFYGFQGGCNNYWNPGEAMLDGTPIPKTKACEWMVEDEWLKTFTPTDPNFYMTDAFTDNAIAWLKEYQNEDKPFLLYMAYNAPHWPLHAKESDIAKYKGRYDAGYQAIQKERYNRMLKNNLINPETTPLNPQKIKAWESLSADEQKSASAKMEVHAAMVDSLDQNIGRLLDELKRQNKLDNTLVLFFADNGASNESADSGLKGYKPTGAEKLGNVFSYEAIENEWAQVINCPLSRYKKTSNEGGVCTPMIAHWPAKMTQKNQWFNEPAHVVDILTTVADLCGASYPETFNNVKTKPAEGISIVPSFTMESLPERKNTMGFDFAMGQGVRDGNWKLVKFAKDDWELYDISKDRTETKNLAAQHPEKVQEMVKKFAAWNKQCSANLPKKKK